MSDQPDDFNLDPTDPHAYTRERAAHLRKRYGPDTVWDPDFGGIDLGAAQARKASKELRDAIAAAGGDENRPMVFSVSIAGRSIRIEVRQQEDGQFTCLLPVEIAPGHWEWRTLLAPGYDTLIANINRILAAGRTIRDLTPQESLELGLLAAQNPGEAFARYMELRCGKESEDLLRDPRFLPTYNQGVIFVFAHTTPQFPNTPEAIAYIKSFAAGRPLNIEMCKAAMKSYQAQPQEEEPPHVGEAELQNASDKELSESLRGLARARAEQDRKKRELVYGR